MTSLVDRVKALSVEEGDCWVWQGTLKKGLPMVNIFAAGKWVCTPVRRALLLDSGFEFRGKQHQARTTCGNPLCVSPDHVKPYMHKGSRGKKQNGYKLDAAARLRIAEANRRHKAKLTWEKVREIRSRPEPASQLEPIYGVSKTLINNIRGYRAWVEPSNPFAALF